MKNIILALLALLPVQFAYANTNPEAVENLNELLRGELSAVETYRQALDKVQGQPEANKLRQVQMDHQQVANKITKHVISLGGKPSQSSGAWGTWATTVEGSAKLLGNAAAFKALKEGEEHGVKEYQEILEETSVPQSVKDDLKTNLSKQQEHIKILDQFIDNA